jgi:arylformamidase
MPSGLIDITRPLAPGLPVWPGDVPFELRQRTEDGVLVSALVTTCHAGTHVDAPLHVAATGVAVDGIPLDRLVGPAEVVQVVPVGGLVSVASLPVGFEPGAPRVLLRTDSHPVGAPVDGRFAGLATELVDWLADRGVVLVGIDTPSVDPYSDTSMSSHRLLLERGLTWLEGLTLDGVRPGLYRLLALPLRLVGAEAAPVRAVLELIATNDGGDR